MKAIHIQAKVNISVFTETRSQCQGHQILCWSVKTYQCLQTHQVLHMYRLWETNLNATVKPKLFTQD